MAIDSGRRQQRTICIFDIVESTQILERNEVGFMHRYQAMLEFLEDRFAKSRIGRIVKRLGDGAQLDFATVPSAIDAAFALRRWNSQRNERTKDSNVRPLLRIAVHYGPVFLHDGDVDGAPIMLATRLLELANPNDVVISADAREHLTAYLDAEITDLGDRYVKHVSEPVRSFRLGPPDPAGLVPPSLAAADLRPTIAVIPFDTMNVETDNMMLGQIVANELISALSQSQDLNVISRLSTTAFHGRNSSLDTIASHLKADYVLSGAYQAYSGKVVLHVELADCHNGDVVWSKRLEKSAGNFLIEQEDLIDEIIAAVATAVVYRELEKSRNEPLPSLKNYTLLLAAITLMHRLSARDFEKSREMLETIVGRATRLAIPRAWLAKWHILRVQQGWTENPDRDVQLALENTQRALDADPRCSLALAVDGFVHTNGLRRLDIAEERYQRALAVNPNDSLAWLFKGTLHAFKGDGEIAVSETGRAIRLSPLDPHRYFYESLGATAHLAAHQFDDALEMANRSLRLNCTHTSTLRVIVIALWSLGRHDEARQVAGRLLEIDPSLTISRYKKRSPSMGFATGDHWSTALRESGVPEN